jgi:hypothetical protein
LASWETASSRMASFLVAIGGRLFCTQVSNFYFFSRQIVCNFWMTWMMI